MVAEQSFLVPVQWVIHRYFQTSGSVAEIGKMQIQLREIVIWFVLLG